MGHENVLCDYKFACKGINIRGKIESVSYTHLTSSASEAAVTLTVAVSEPTVVAGAAVAAAEPAVRAAIACLLYTSECRQRQ